MSDAQEFVKDAVEKECLRHGINEDGLADILWLASVATVEGVPRYRFSFGRVILDIAGEETEYVVIEVIASTQAEAEKKMHALSPKLPDNETYAFKIRGIEEIA